MIRAGVPRTRSRARFSRIASAGAGVRGCLHADAESAAQLAECSITLGSLGPSSAPPRPTAPDPISRAAAAAAVSAWVRTFRAERFDRRGLLDVRRIAKPGAP